jgi:predicted PurR-regulated permease PerM
MVAPTRTSPGRLRVTNRSVALAVVIVAGSLFLFDKIGLAGRVLGWLVVAAIAASLLHPAVTALDRFLPRALGLVIVLVLTLGTVGGLVYSGIDDVRTQADRLEREAPRAARDLEARDDGIGEAAREFELERRVRQFVEELPERLQGGEAAEALRSAATRGVAFFATGMLTLFLLIHGAGLIGGALRQVHDVERRARLEDLLRGAYRRAWRYVVLTLARCALAGFFTVAVASTVDVPAQTLLALWAAAWAIVPMIGVVTGSLPLLGLTLAFEPGAAPWVAALFVGYQAAEILLLQRRIERVSVSVGPVVTLAAALAGLEAYGIGGLFATTTIAIVAVAVLTELAAQPEGDVVAAADALLPGDEAVEGEAPA